MLKVIAIIENQNDKSTECSNVLNTCLTINDCVRIGMA